MKAIADSLEEPGQARYWRNRDVEGVPQRYLFLPVLPADLPRKRVARNARAPQSRNMSKCSDVE